MKNRIKNMSEFKYKVGDKVRIKSIDWYNKNKNKFGKVWTSGGQIPFDKCMSEWCGKVMTISHVRVDHYTMVEDLVEYWTDEMIEGLVEEERVSNVNSITQDRVDKLACKHDEELPSGNPYEWECPEGYQFVDENGNVINATKIVLEKKEKGYPKTYEECYKIMGVKLSDCYIQGYKSPLLEDLQELLICRDAYWKLYGEEMGLGKPWEPDFTDKYSKSYVITAASGIIHMTWTNKQSYILAFPSEEIRNAFYENFKELIESVKELL